LSLFFFVYCSFPHRSLHSFPTRRSSDLVTFPLFVTVNVYVTCSPASETSFLSASFTKSIAGSCSAGTSTSSGGLTGGKLGSSGRSEEHTSELQSRFDLVCRLLLEKKKRS